MPAVHEAVSYTHLVKVCTRAAGLLGDREVAVDGLVLELVHELTLDLGRAIILKDTPVHVCRMMKVHTHATRTTRELLLHAQEDVYKRQPLKISWNSCR